MIKLATNKEINFDALSVIQSYTSIYNTFKIIDN